MKNYRIPFGMAILLASMKLFSQENFAVTEQQTKEILKTYGAKSIIIHPVEKKQVEYTDDDYFPAKRSAYILQDSIINPTSLSGSFVRLPNKYFVVLEDKGKFVKNELLDETDANNRARRHESSYYLVQRKDTEQYYYVMSNVYLSNLKEEKENQEVLDVIHKLGYKEYKVGEDFYIKSKTSEIKVDTQLLNRLKQNPNYIKTLDHDQTKIAELVQQTIPHSKSLDKYLSIYNIKGHHTPVATIDEWRLATENANKLFNQIYKLNEKYDGDYSFTLLDKSNTYNKFLNNLNASKVVLGM